MLGDREKIVLHTIIKEYISSSEPVGSRNVSKLGPLKMSPATIRNIMGDLEEKGYIFQPYTSAGRVPTDLGYKYYIQNLVSVESVSQVEHETLNFNSPNIPVMLQEFSKRLSLLTKSVGFIITSKPKNDVFKKIEFLRLNKTSALAIMVTSSGQVQNVIIRLNKHTTENELVMIGNYLSSQLLKMNISDLSGKIKKELESSTGELRKILSKLIMIEAEMGTERLYVEGASNILDFPEFQDSDIVKGLLKAIEEKKLLTDILEKCISNKGVQIFVGREAGLGIEELGLVASQYSKNGNVVGMVGVIGPKRMEYGKVISVVNYSSQVLEQMIKQLHGGYSE